MSAGLFGSEKKNKKKLNIKVVAGDYMCIWFRVWLPKP
jgi:hypothetical protein